MHYLSYSLNGSFEMVYSDRAYLGTQEPGAALYETALDMPDSRFDVISDAIPGYWEDMTDKFATAQFYRTLRVNPEYGLWRYPLISTKVKTAGANVNLAFNVNDKTTKRCK